MPWYWMDIPSRTTPTKLHSLILHDTLVRSALETNSNGTDTDDNGTDADSDVTETEALGVRP